MVLNRTRRDILETIEALPGPHKNRYVADHEIAEWLGLTLQQVRDYLDHLKQTGYVDLAKNHDGYAALTTWRGRLALQDPESIQTLADMLTGENAALEYKSSMRWDLGTQQVNKALEKGIAKTVAGFLNSEGGALLIGVADDCMVLGIEHDLKTIGRKDRDGYEQQLHQVLTDALGAEFSQYQHVSFEESEGKTVCIVRVEPSPEPVYLMDKGAKEFYVRVGNTTRPLDVQAAHDYISMHWPA